MSNIYIQEPPTNGKVLLVTSMGDIDIELWSKETPRACRNFVQLCMEGYYDDTIFHRVIKGFIVQGGDPTGTGLGGDSIYGKPFKDEFHSRLRFCRRGLVAMANSGIHDNSSQFFFTFAATPELNGKHTLFAKVGGNTIYNMLKLANVETGPEDRPLYPPKIIKTQILLNPFEDIVPREPKKAFSLPEEITDSSLGSQTKATKNFSLLSFGSDAEEEEEETLKLNKDIKGKSKSSHDLSNDPNLSSVPAVDDDGLVEDGEVIDTIAPSLPVTESVPEQSTDDGAQAEPEVTKSEELHNEAKRLKREIQQSKKATKAIASETMENYAEAVGNANDLISQYKSLKHKYKRIKKGQKMGDRETQTLNILHKFQTKLAAIKAVSEGLEDQQVKELENDEEKFDVSWFNHKLDFSTESQSGQVIDANIYDANRYDVQDPRNPINKRKREADSESMKQGLVKFK